MAHGDRVNDGHFIIGRGQGISQAIATEIGLTKAQCKKVDWESVFELVNKAKNNTTVKWGGGDKLYKECCTGNYVVNIGDKFEFSADTWQQIVTTVKDSLERKKVNTDNLLPVGEVTEDDQEVVQNGTQEEVTAEQTVEQGPDPHHPELPSGVLLQMPWDEKPVNRNEFREMISEIMRDNPIIEHDENGNIMIDTGAKSYVKIYGYDIKDPLNISNCKFDEIYLDENGNISRKIARSGDGTVEHYNDYWYDGNQLTRLIEYDNTNDKLRTVTDYYPNGKIKQETLYKDDGSIESICTYNQQGQMIRDDHSGENPPYYVIIERGADGVAVKSTTKFKPDGTTFVEPEVVVEGESAPAPAGIPNSPEAVVPPQTLPEEYANFEFPTDLAPMPEAVSPLYGPGYIFPDTDYAGQTYTRLDGTKCEYDDKGYIIKDYDTQGHCIREIDRWDDGSIHWFTDYQYKGDKLTRGITRGNDGSIWYFHDYQHKDDKLTRDIRRYKDGSIIFVLDYEYDNGKLTRGVYIAENFVNITDYYPDGKIKKQDTTYSMGALLYYNTWNKQGKYTRATYVYEDLPYYEIIEYEADGKTEKCRTKYNLDGTPFVEPEE